MNETCETCEQNSGWIRTYTGDGDHSVDPCPDCQPEPERDPVDGLTLADRMTVWLEIWQQGDPSIQPAVIGDIEEFIAKRQDHARQHESIDEDTVAVEDAVVLARPVERDATRPGIQSTRAPGGRGNGWMAPAPRLQRRPRSLPWERPAPPTQGRLRSRGI